MEDVNVGRLRTTISGKPWSRGFQRPLDRMWPRNLACAIGCCDAGWSCGGRAAAHGGVAAPHNAGDAAVGGPAAEIARLQRENERLRMERDILKKSIAIFAGVPK